MADKTNRHLHVAEAIRDALRTQTFFGLQADDIFISDEWDDEMPAHGIHVQIQPEQKATGTSALSDIRYWTLITRVVTINSTRGDDTDYRSEFRVIVRKLFDEKRLNLDATREIINRVKPYTWRDSKRWQNAGLDVSSMLVSTLIREDR